MNQNRRIKLLSFGEILWDIIDGQAHIGGAPFNLAAHAARCGINSYLLTRVGTDDLGRRAMEETARAGVNRQYIQTDPRHPTGTVTVTLSADGQPSYIIHKNAAWDFIDLQNGAGSQFAAKHFDVICFGTLAQRAAGSLASLWKALKILRNVPAFYDVNLRQNYYSRELILAGLKRATVLKLNNDEVAVLSDLIFGKHLKADAFARAVRNEFPVKIVLITMGSKGCFVAEKDKAVLLKGQRVKIADTVGAGDAFSAAFLTGWLRGRTAIEAAAMGNLLGAFVASRSGATPDYDEDIRHRLGLADEERQEKLPKRQSLGRICE